MKGSNMNTYVCSSTYRRLSWVSFSLVIVCRILTSAGYFGTQWILSTLMVTRPGSRDERLHYVASMMFNTWAMIALQSYKIRSAYLFAIMSSIMLVGLASNYIFQSLRSTQSRVGDTSSSQLGLAETYGPALLGCIVVGIEGLTTVLDVFVPLAGRLGKDAPSENIVATLSISMVLLFIPALPPLFHRLGRSWQRSVLRYLVFGSVAAMVVFGGPWWNTYDAMHPKRTVTQYLYNVSLIEWFLPHP